MQKLYFVARIAAYLFGLLGMILFTLGRRSVPINAHMTAIGAALLGLSFVCFMITYVAFTLSKLTSRPK